MIKDLLWQSSDDFKDQVTKLIQNDVIDIDIREDIREDIDYNLLSQNSIDDDIMWALLYYSGYLTSQNDDHLRIPNKEVFIEWQGWIRKKSINQIKPDSMLKTLLQGNLTKFGKELPKLIMKVLSYHDVQDNLVESNYHLFIVGLFSQAQFCGYKMMSNKEGGLGRFDLKIEPTEHADYLTSVIMEFKIIKNKNSDDDEYDPIDDYEETGPNEDEVECKLRKKAKEGLEQISKNKYDSDINSRSTKLVECGIAFQGKQTCVLSRVLRKERDQWVEDS